MVKQKKLDKTIRKSLLDAQKLIETVAKADGNEAETRKRVDRIFETVMGYDTFQHISREYAVKGVGDTEHADFAIQVDEGATKPVIMVELKRVNIDLVPKHVKQAASYAINIGCEWVLLTNGKEWRLYHVTFAQPPQTKLVESWRLADDNLELLAEKFELIGYKNVKKGGLEKLWEKRNVLTPRNVLKALLSEASLSLMRRELKKTTGVMITPEEIVGSIRSLLNEAAGIEMENIKISLPKSGQIRRTRKSKTIQETNTDDG